MTASSPLRLGLTGGIGSGKSTVAQMLAARGGAVIVTFVDLPAQYGGPTNVDLFGQPATLGIGIDSLARVVGATVAPLCVSSSTRGTSLSFIRMMRLPRRASSSCRLARR